MPDQLPSYAVNPSNFNAGSLAWSYLGDSYFAGWANPSNLVFATGGLLGGYGYGYNNFGYGYGSYAYGYDSFGYARDNYWSAIGALPENPLNSMAQGSLLLGGSRGVPVPTASSQYFAGWSVIPRTYDAASGIWTNAISPPAPPPEPVVAPAPQQVAFEEKQPVAQSPVSTIASTAAAEPTSAPSQPVRRAATEWNKEDVLKILDNIDPQVAAFWRSYGDIFNCGTKAIASHGQDLKFGFKANVSVPSTMLSREVAWEVSERARASSWSSEPVGRSFRAYLKATGTVAESPAIYKVFGIPVGRLDGNGWIYLDIGGRATVSALRKLVDTMMGTSLEEMPRMVPQDTLLTQEKIFAALPGTRSPFKIVKGSTNIGIFIDGTANHLESLTNVVRLYNAYDGTKFYYGGPGNPVDWDGVENMAGNAFGYGWDTILDRAEADVVSRWHPGALVDIVGFSRGAAMSNEFAKRLDKRGIPVRFLGLYDPVYSYSHPGQGSDLVEATEDGLRGNYVTATMPQNVKSAVVYYAAHETRAMFPATFFRHQSST